MNNDKRAQISGNIDLIYTGLIFLILVLFLIGMNLNNTAIREETTYTNVERASGDVGAVTYEAGWLANSLANQAIVIQDETITLGEALTKYPSNEVVGHIKELTDLLEIHIVNTHANKRIRGYYLLFIQDNRLIDSRLLGGGIVQGRYDGFPRPIEYFSRSAQQTNYGLVAYKQMLQEERQQDRVGELAWTVIPGEKEAVIVVIVW